MNSISFKYLLFIVLFDNGCSRWQNKFPLEGSSPPSSCIERQLIFVAKVRLKII
jgi:hypothetical protein